MKQVRDFSVKKVNWLNSNTFILHLQTNHDLPPIFPGNFAEIKVDNHPEVFLRRPFSVFDVDTKQNILSFFIKVIGKGTEKLGSLKKGERVNIIYPLGNSFSLVKNQKVLVVGGGSGIAPFVLLGKELKKINTEITFLFGAKSKEDIVLNERFRELGSLTVTTEDGSFGEKGLVTQHPVFDKLKDFDFIYSCGPEPMMKAVGLTAKQNDISCEVSLENLMACGFGACLCCVVDTPDGHKCVCTEGPVFNINDLKW